MTTRRHWPGAGSCPRSTECDRATRGGPIPPLTWLTRDRRLVWRLTAIVSWPAGRNNTGTRRLVELVKAAAVGEIFWRRLSGLIFFAPLCGMAAGAAFGALEGAFRVF